MKAAIIRFPGSNCDQDCFYALNDVFNVETHYVWHKETSVEGFGLIVLPGGFSYGDYLRCGAIARYSPVMKSVVREAEKGTHVLGICNGFQILCEAQLLPGALVRNAKLKYVCKTVDLDVVNGQTRFTAGYGGRRQIVMTVGNGEGNF